MTSRERGFPISSVIPNLPALQLLNSPDASGPNLIVLIGRQRARGVDARGRLDSHDDRAIVGEHPSPRRTGHHPHEIEDFDVFER